MNKGLINKDFVLGLQKLVNQHIIPLPETGQWGKTTLKFQIFKDQTQHENDREFNREQLHSLHSGDLGLYVIQSEEKILYVGEGAIKQRMVRHHDKLITPSANAKNREKRLHRLYNDYCGAVSFYWYLEESAYNRKKYEYLLNCTLDPLYEYYLHGYK